MDREVLRNIRESFKASRENLAWLRANMDPAFFRILREEPEPLAVLCLRMRQLSVGRQIVLDDRENALMTARLSVPGSLYETLLSLDREVACCEIVHSRAPVPGTGRDLEFQRYEFAPGSDPGAPPAAETPVPARLRRLVAMSMKGSGAGVPPAERDRLLDVLRRNNPRFVRLSPPERVARILRLLHRAAGGPGVHIEVGDAEAAEAGTPAESEVLVGVENPPQRDYLRQLMEVFNRLDLGVRSAFSLIVASRGLPYFLGAFRVARRDGGLLEKDSRLHRRLLGELYNVQLLSNGSETYRRFVQGRLMTGAEATLVEALIGFCHTSLVHNQPHRFTLEDVARAFHSHPDVALMLARAFSLRFDPEVPDRGPACEAALSSAAREIEEYNTGHRQLDGFRREVFRAALAFVRRTLKTNFYVQEKQALAFRLDPGYLSDLGADFTSDLPPRRPFRVTFFFGRNGLGYHVGFSDIARGGWRTVMTRSRDDYVTVANAVFRECYVLAHTQHLKNKDIYEGGSKMVAVVRARSQDTRELAEQRLHKVQHAFANAFFDIFVTSGGKARDPRVVDYYGEDEPIELGPDENMHDRMIEAIARLSAARGYVLGIGVMSSKKAGINHRQYGVTSTGVARFAEVAMREAGTDIRRDAFSVKFTGGPNGDVAGNAMRILLERCPRASIRLILDGSGALFDPEGLDREELSRLLLRRDIDAFRPEALHPGGFLLYRNERRTEGLRELFKRADRAEEGVSLSWVTADEFNREFDTLAFTVPADLFIPAGGRPETVDGTNWRAFLSGDGTPSARVIVEGANSFLTPEARERLQKRGVVILKDSSANKCGVISSSYEIIGNLMMTEKEFLAHREEYVRDVLAILERRAGDEAECIFRRRREDPGRSYTEISDAISGEIDERYSRLFEFFRERPGLPLARPWRMALLAHLPAFLRDRARYRRRVSGLPAKYLCAIPAREIAAASVYRGEDGWWTGRDFDRELRRYVAETFGHGRPRARAPRD